MTPHEATEAMWELLDELRTTRFVPNEDRDRDRPGQLGFDYGYHQALAEVQSRLYLAFPDEPAHVARRSAMTADTTK